MDEWKTETDGREGVWAVTDDHEVWSVYFKVNVKGLSRQGLRYKFIGPIPELPGPAVDEKRWHRPSNARPLKSGLWWVRHYVGNIQSPHSFVINLSHGTFPTPGVDYAYIGPTPPNPMEQE